MFAGAPEHLAWQPAPPARSAAIDVMRAVAIMLVVFGHVQRGLFQTGEASGLYWDAVYPVVDYFIYVFHVPVFFATSGVLLERHGEQTRRQFGARIGRLVLLYLLWNTINAIPAVVFSGYINRSFGKQLALGDGEVERLALMVRPGDRRRAGPYVKIEYLLEGRQIEAKIVPERRDRALHHAAEFVLHGACRELCVGSACPCRNSRLNEVCRCVVGGATVTGGSRIDNSAGAL